jgi:hypothetical protein
MFPSRMTAEKVSFHFSGLLEQYPSVRRIVFSSGKTSAALFARMNRAWLKSRPFRIAPTPFSQAVFGRLVNTATEDILLSAPASLTTNSLPHSDYNGLSLSVSSVAMEAIPRKLEEESWRSSEGLRPIELIVPLSVSPAGSASLR